MDIVTFLLLSLIHIFHYIDDKTAAMNLHLVLMMAALEDGLWQ